MESWGLEKKLPIAFIFLLLSQLTLGAWFVSKFDSRLTTLENQSPKVLEELVKLQAARELSALANTKLEGGLANIQNILTDLKERSNQRNPEFRNNPALNKGEYTR